jgi:uncharacterized protein (TIGR00156 family)
MKFTSAAALLGAASFTALAQPGGFVSTDVSGAPTGGGFKGPAVSLTSVAQASSLRDNAWVVMEGRIVRQLGHELYEFEDGSGSVKVDIDDKRWLAQTVTPADKVRIEGEVDRDWNSVEIDVKNVRVVK